jgi:hypothetical protein
VAPAAVSASLPDTIQKLAAGGRPFEALYDITGQQGADLGKKLEEVRARP